MKHNAKYFIVMILILMAALMAACGKQETPPPSGSSEQEQNQQNSSNSAAGTVQGTTFTFKDIKGEHTLPQQPKNIATTVTYLTDHFIALGLTPALTVKSQNEDFPAYLQPFLKDVKIIGEQGRVNLETLLEEAPDLIVTDTNSSEIYEKYAKIASTAMLENGYVAPNWEEAFRATASAFGLSGKAEEIITGFENHKKEIAEKIKERTSGKTLMVLRIRNDVRYYGDMDYGWLYDDMGFTRPSVFPVTSPESRYEVLSNEKLPEIDPDYILLINDNNEIYNELQNLAVWKNMKAVKNNQVYQVASDSWFGGYGPNAANSMLDDLTRYFEN